MGVALIVGGHLICFVDIVGEKDCVDVNHELLFLPCPLTQQLDLQYIDKLCSKEFLECDA